jgi:RNA polymerase sigma factor (sigma-70 family)
MNTSSATVLSFQNPNLAFPIHLERDEKLVIQKKPDTCYSDRDIIEGLKTRDIMTIKYLYKQYYRQISFMVTTNSGNKMDAEDLFQDALIVLYQKISNNTLNLTSSFYTYLYSICWHLWLQKLNKREYSTDCSEISDELTCDDDHEYDHQIEETEKYRLFQHHFLRLNEDDQKVLKLYMSKTPLKEIASIMGYKSDKYAKFRKYICKEKLKALIMNDPNFHDIYQAV